MSKTLRARIERLEKALADRERPPFVIVLVDDGETLAQALGRHPGWETAVFAAAISTDYEPDVVGSGGRGWLQDAPAMGRA